MGKTFSKNKSRKEIKRPKKQARAGACFSIFGKVQKCLLELLRCNKYFLDV